MAGRLFADGVLRSKVGSGKIARLGSITWMWEVAAPVSLACSVPLTTIVPRSFQSGLWNDTNGLPASMSRVHTMGSVVAPLWRSRHVPEVPLGIAWIRAWPRSFGRIERGVASERSRTFLNE
jgi:hypothetical protein